jgi:uncharacterized protein YqhQ
MTNDVKYFFTYLLIIYIYILSFMKGVAKLFGEFFNCANCHLTTELRIAKIGLEV